MRLVIETMTGLRCNNTEPLDNSFIGMNQSNTVGYVSINDPMQN